MCHSRVMTTTTLETEELEQLVGQEYGHAGQMERLRNSTIFSPPISCRSSSLEPPLAARIRQPFIANFMLLVPDASLPTVLQLKHPPTKHIRHCLHLLLTAKFMWLVEVISKHSLECKISVHGEKL